ncbi:SDR family NAD(P)-dependent oxidoreductase [Actinopolymorpha pittospori]|uniref:NAD(P)-dependent dehydrogenase (Short-subunit alcohol dehydrogenase family) n=1 Tax=Actinopolymorpha pittospori TaxID=648752 RepID=A0A927N1P2_9ACTN|nr:SDR family NAD(P)-dependent oxidoreductase [Actinopolymorpha pittospori]MBE1607302.1 NAD(P)-dependent dehydrogenase (short-subunit alcohol dehydrogenase family) [Actinopolymorpha pittospori]
MTNKVWFVTGSARGLGRAIIEGALRAGGRVAATARDEGRLDDLVRTYGEAVLPIRLDVADAAAARRAVEEAVRTFGRIDVVVNNAGYANLASVEDTTEEDFRAQVETNLFGVVNVTKAALPVLRRQGQGRIINVSSVGGRATTPGLAPYQMSKWAVSGFSEVLAQEVAPLGIKVTAIEPGGMRTDWAGSSMTVAPLSNAYAPTIGVLAGIVGNIAARAAGDPAKVAQAVRRIVEMDDPPVRILLGSDALTVAKAAADALATSDASVEELSRSTDHDDATPAELDPLGVGARSE